MMLPLDVANRESTYGGIPMETLWITIYIMIAVLVILIIPWAYNYYTAYDPEKKSYELRFLKINAIFIEKRLGQHFVVS